MTKDFAIGLLPRTQLLYDEAKRTLLSCRSKKHKLLWQKGRRFPAGKKAFCHIFKPSETTKDQNFLSKFLMDRLLHDWKGHTQQKICSPTSLNPQNRTFRSRSITQLPQLSTAWRIKWGWNLSTRRKFSIITGRVLQHNTRNWIRTIFR